MKTVEVLLLLLLFLHLDVGRAEIATVGRTSPYLPRDFRLSFFLPSFTSFTSFTSFIA